MMLRGQHGHFGNRIADDSPQARTNWRRWRAPGTPVLPRLARLINARAVRSRCPGTSTIVALQRAADWHSTSSVRAAPARQSHLRTATICSSSHTDHRIISRLRYTGFCPPHRVVIRADIPHRAARTISQQRWSCGFHYNSYRSFPAAAAGSSSPIPTMTTSTSANFATTAATSGLFTRTAALPPPGAQYSATATATPGSLNAPPAAGLRCWPARCPLGPTPSNS